MWRSTKSFAAAVACGLITLFTFELTDWDMNIQQHFYNADFGSWLVNSDQPVLRALFYDGPKALLILLAIILLVAIPFLRKPCRRATSLAVLSLVLVPLLVGGLKATTNMPCPKAIAGFGGSIPNVKVLERYPAGFYLESRQRCFPAGHASGGFGLFGLIFLTRKPHLRRRIVGLGLVAGSCMGGYKMLIGDHFMSHTLITLCIAWIVVSFLSHWESEPLSVPS